MLLFMPIILLVLLVAWRLWIRTEHNYTGMCEACFNRSHHQCTHTTPNRKPCLCEMAGHSEEAAATGFRGMSDTPLAGWYPNPEDSTQQRYWDGQQWTDHRAPLS